MIVYEVTLELDPAVASAVEDYMRRRHIPVIFATGCFRRIRFQETNDHRFRTAYEAETESDLNRYLQEYAPGLRAEFLAEFPRGVTIARETWQDREVWG